MAQSKLELAVGTGQWDAGLKKAQQALNSFTQAQGGLQQALQKDNGDMQKFIQMMGKMDSTAATTKGQMNDYKRVLEQLTADYNKMSDAQKKSIGTDYLQTIDALKEKFKSAKQQVDEFNRSLGNTSEIKLPEGGIGLFGGGKLDGMLQVFGGNLMTKAADFAASFASEIGSCVQQGIELARQGEGIRIAFERLGRGDILDGLREATHGTVADIELMKAAVKFNDFKLPVEELGTMLAFAQQKAKDTGQSVDYMVDSIVTGLGRKSLMILDNLGLSATEIRERMKETGDMTKAVGAIIRDQMAKAGDYVETAADRAAQANVSLQNKMEELGRKFAPIEEASNQLWTSMKIGILDIIGGPLARMLNDFTEAGRLMNALNSINGDGSGNKETKVEKALRMLREYSGGGNGVEGKRDLYNRQMALYSANEEKDWRNYNNLKIAEDAYRKKMYQRGQNAGDQAVLDSFAKQIENARNRALAWQQMAAQYEKGAQAMFNSNGATPSATPTATTKNDKKDLDELQKIQAQIAALTKEAYTADEGRQKEIRQQIGGLQEQEKKLIAIRDLVTGKGTPGFSMSDAVFSTPGLDLGGNNSKAQNKVDLATAAFVGAGTSNADIAAYVSSLKSALQDANIGSELYTQLSEQLKDATTMSTLLQELMERGMAGADLENTAQALKDKLLSPDGIEQSAVQAWLDELNKQIEEAGGVGLKLNPETGEVSDDKDKGKDDGEGLNKLNEGIGKMASGLSQVTGGLKAVGVEIPKEVDQALGVINGVSQIISGVGTIISIFGTTAITANTTAVGLNTAAIGGLIAALEFNSATNFFGLANGGIVPAFAQGGLIGRAAAGMMIPGNSMSGDRLRLPVDGGRGMIGVNSGELILNKSSQNTLAADLLNAEALIGSIKDYSSSLGNAQQAILAQELEGGPKGQIVRVEGVLRGSDIILAINNESQSWGQGTFITTK